MVRCANLHKIDEAIRRGRVDDPGTCDIAELPRSLRLIRGDDVPNAAVVLFRQGGALLPDYPPCAASPGLAVCR
jgi:hypothetical protein